MIYMHREILGLKKEDGIYSDHIDYNGLNNRRCNLRKCTNVENIRHQRCQTRNKSSKFKGVCWNKQEEKWQAYIYYNEKLVHLGRFNNEIEAAEAYDKKAIELFGEFASLNFPYGTYKSKG